MERIVYLHGEFCAVAEDRRLVEYIPLDPAEETGRILWGKVDRIMPGLDAAFVDIGRRKAGFLPLKENSATFQGSTLRSGERALLQIRKEETGEKGAYLTRDLSLPGSYLILMPMNRHIGVSARVGDETDRARMLETGARLAEGRFGLVMREAALEAPEQALREERDELLRRWEAVTRGEIPDIFPAAELMRDYAPKGIDRVIRDEPLPADLARQLTEASNRRITLPHGGNIVIDRCEAMTVIDVNSASSRGGGSRRETVLETNLEACREIMRQTRLRNLSGILILDMIDMDTDADREQVQKALEDAFRLDRIKTVIHGYTRLGLLEMTRKRTRPTLAEMTERKRPQG
ncbi:MAG: ribonuclease E/G [Clostridia bacterium]|nr:ribonuclease E/G [Clostridia bacterium]